jgi:fibronectin type III domain protein/subtilase family protein
MTYFSSRGPNLLSPDIISPDVTAPGLRILAGASPLGLTGPQGELFQAIAGTSMSSPHVAGTYALLKQAHPDWTPAEAKSALMTSARQNIFDPSDGQSADPFDFGAGHIVPGGNISKAGSLYNPGLVYDAGFNDYLGYICEADRSVFSNPEATCAGLASAGVATTAENLNLASIGISDVAGTATVTRRVTNVTGRNSTWSASVKAPAGFTVVVSPDHLSLAPDETAEFTVTFTRTDAAYDTWSFGSLTWNGRGGYHVRSPIAAQAVVFAAPDDVKGTGTDGTGTLTIGFGYDGVYSADAQGLIAATETPGNVIDDPANDINVALATGIGITEHIINVPDGTSIARFSLFDAEVDGADDLDLYVFGPDGSFVGGSGSGTAEEQVDVDFPAPGDYSVIVHGWQTDGPDSNYTLFSWSVPLTDGAGSLSITSAPTVAVSGTTAEVVYAWAGLTAGGRYLGAISHTGPDGLLAITKVTVNA